MPQIVQISLRLPSLRIRVSEGAEPTTVDNSDVRFTKQIEVQSIPKPGETLSMSIDNGETFPCEVVQANWRDDKNMFVVACRYSKRSISPADYEALMASSDWQMKALLSP